MSDVEMEELGPVDYLVIEFPAGHRTSRARWRGAPVSRSPGPSGCSTCSSSARTRTASTPSRSTTPRGRRDPCLEADIAKILAADDVELLAESMEPGSFAGVLVFENRGRPVRRRHPPRRWQLIANGRIPIQAIAASIEAELASKGRE